MAVELVASIAFLAFGARNFPVDGFDATAVCRLQWQNGVVENGKNLLVGGAVRCGPFGSRSILIRSTDGGAHWREVGRPTTGRTLAHLHAVSARTLFAVQSHMEEGAGPDTLVRSDDGGARWREVGDLPKGEHPNQVVLEDLRFSDARRGKAALALLWGNENHVTISLVTKTGGASWEFVGVDATWSGGARDAEVKATPAPSTTPTPAAVSSPRDETTYRITLKNGTVILLPKEDLLSKLAKTN
jgi:hypothetical protein